MINIYRLAGILAGWLILRILGRDKYSGLIVTFAVLLSLATDAFMFSSGVYYFTLWSVFFFQLFEFLWEK